MKEVLELSYIDTDDWGRPVYKDQFEKLWKDVELGDRETPSLCSVSGNSFDGEPDCPINKEFVILTPFIKNNKRFEYMMLNRLKSDCETHLDIENKYRRKLKEDEMKATIQAMKDYWNGFEEDEKPEWLTWDQILDYEKRMAQTV
ncbi:LPD11 domain-containing protein [Paenibacillus sp. Dod16]|uniref:LPD11 domain-containing protein n=1 Tax=Paenibacillus sp. Dod16 TaxID=3416392 RepID=UPI003CF562F1